MSIRNLLAQYKEHKNGISHCTFNPEGPGVVRIHLVPPRFRLFGDRTYIVILNGYYMLPLGYSWALLLSKFMNEVNAFAGKPITENDEERIFKNTVKKTKSVYPSMSKEDIEEDLEFILRVLFAVARGDDPEIEIEKLSLRQYGKNMTAPHRMDLLISAMTDAEGKWQCNQKCTFCYAAGQCKSQAKELGTDDWKKIIEKLYKNGIEFINLTIGNPYLIPHINRPYSVKSPEDGSIGMKRIYDVTKEITDSFPDIKFAVSALSYEGENAAIIGHVTDKRAGRVTLKGGFSSRVLTKLTGSQLPRIC